MAFPQKRKLNTDIRNNGHITVQGSWLPGTQVTTT
jgi:hypothetical protein